MRKTTDVLVIWIPCLILKDGVSLYSLAPLVIILKKGKVY